MAIYHHPAPFPLEGGSMLPEIEITYDAYGTLNRERNNVIWICHALTANSAAAEWWPPLVGPGALWDTDKYFVICANILGSCYGTTGPTSVDPRTGQPYFSTFPPVTIRDMVRAHALLAAHLRIDSIYLLAGGSMGGYQAIEWCAIAPYFIKRLFLIATSAQESAWGKAVHEAQRLAIEADPSWREPSASGGKGGLIAARAIGMLTYRTYAAFEATQRDEEDGKLDGFKAPSYIRHQGNKLGDRFNAFSYWLLTKAMDTHNLGRGRGGVAQVLRSLPQQALVMSISSDGLCPPAEQALIASGIPKAELVVIDSLYGHDGFLIETGAITERVGRWLQTDIA